MVQPTLREMSLKEAHESFSSNSRGPTHEERRLQIEELDEWRTHKPRTHDKPKLCQNELDTFPNQLQVGDKVLLDAADPHIVTARPDEEIPFTVLSIFPFGFSIKTRPSTRACLGPCENRAKDFPNTGYDKTPRPSDIAVVEPVKLTWAWTLHTRAWEKQAKLDTVIQHGHVHPHAQGTMSSSRGKKIAVPASKRRKGASSFVGPTTKIRQPLLQFPLGPQEELFQILRAQPLIVGRCIDWAAAEQVQLADAIRALLTTDHWELFFGIIEPTYLELTMELCSTFHLQTVMTNYDDPDTIQFRLGRLVRQFNVPEFGTALGLYMEEFKEENELHALTRHIHFSPSKCWHTLALGAASYNPSRSKASVLPPSLRYLHAILAHTITERRESTGIVNTHDAYFLWCMSHGHVIDLAYFIALAIQHQTERHRKGAYEDIPDDVPPQHEDLPSQPPPPSRPIHAAASYAVISEHPTRTYGLMNLYHRRSILLHSHTDCSPKLQFKEFII
ncbi:hypothetical protein GOBAR_AA20836 [Gossypium barbadense]|uniref:Arabidopsis retrotransposon Orf1 C-terminal domain-containing protein n=1 Tax=Gossypium barbadense TaxID=3634 RepID=A0A2P5X922_GOSBA|nr:hypothetical protein GOBAR_AA20836 [Gossypium barbadense]